MASQIPPDQLKASFLSQYSTDGKPVSLKDLLASGRTVDSLNISYLRNSLTEVKRKIEPGEGNDLITKFGEYFKDGKLDDAELGSLKEASIEDLQKLADSNLKIGKDSIKKILDDKVTAEVDSLTKDTIRGINDTINISSLTSTTAILQKKEDLYASLENILTQYEAVTNPTVKAKLKEKFESIKTRVQESLLGSFPRTMTKHSNSLAPVIEQAIIDAGTPGFESIPTRTEKGYDQNLLARQVLAKLIKEQNITDFNSLTPSSKRLLMDKINKYPGMLTGQIKFDAKGWMNSYNQQQSIESELNKIKITE